ncbi:MAG: hypothetical protein QF903_01395 [Planctomycetota bacterium]|jgi:hypothetical protein|nr:hypothetical protein [Planctomycetota bacterium]MDP6764359.1 hypothetical protein [Planctomycetota bacterium]MDP6988117.1 hypothetical protein [Planctomycetota bacterium]
MTARRSPFPFLIPLALTCAALTAWPAGAPSQVRRKLPEPVVERAFETDEEGLRQWTSFDERCATCRGGKTTECEHCKGYEDMPVCAECDGTRKAPCRACRGSGRALDPLEALVCPYCWGSTWYGCKLCKTRGSYPVKGSGDREQKCGACKTRGAFECTPCKGLGFLPAVRFGSKGPGEAKLAKLVRARETLAETLEGLKAYQPVHERRSKSEKAFTKAVDPAARILPAIKGAKSLLATSLKGLGKGAGYVGYADWLDAEFLEFADRTVFLLRHQTLLLDLCIARAEFNESVGDRAER